MGTRRDGALSAVVLAVALLAFVLVDATLSVAFLLLGALGTAVFELLATRRTAAVRRVWERPSVQATAVAFAVLLIAAGSIAAPSVVLSAAIGALLAYVAFLWLVWSDRLELRNGS